MAQGHIEPRVGNLVLIGLVGALGTITVLAVAVWLSKRNVPVATSIADAGLDVVREAAA